MPAYDKTLAKDEQQQLRTLFYCVYRGLCYFCQQLSSRVPHSTDNVRASLSILRETAEKASAGIKFKVTNAYHPGNSGTSSDSTSSRDISGDRFSRWVLQKCYWHL